VKAGIVNATGTVHQLVVAQGLLAPACQPSAPYRPVRPVQALVYALPGCEHCFPRPGQFRAWVGAL
jgi:hypothetical protein